MIYIGTEKFKNQTYIYHYMYGRIGVWESHFKETDIYIYSKDNCKWECRFTIKKIPVHKTRIMKIPQINSINQTLVYIETMVCLTLLEKL